MTEPSAVTTEVGTVQIECVTQAEWYEPLAAPYLEVCTVAAEVIATSRNCPADECGGHPLCGPCYELGTSRGWVASATL